MHSPEVRQAAEPDMEDLLTSIRQAINENVGLPSDGARARPPEVPPMETDPLLSRADEIAALRSKIASQLREPRLTALPRLSSMSGGFAGLLGGDAETDPPLATPQLRTRFLDDEPVDEAPAEEAPAPESEEEPGYAPSHGRSWSAPPPPSFAPRETYPDRGLLSPATTAATNAAFGRLAENMMARAIGDRTIEKITLDLLRGMLKQWLDDNLPEVVERLVREEIERVAQRGSYR
jgi:uncharacterized protein